MRLKIYKVFNNGKVKVLTLLRTNGNCKYFLNIVIEFLLSTVLITRFV